jgi:hypothetical protein
MIQPARQIIHGGFGAPSAIQTSYGMSNSPYKIEVPQPCIEVNKDLQYEFRVLESTKNGEVIKVGLQVKVWEIDHFGVSVVKADWTDVERVRLEV